MNLYGFAKGDPVNFSDPLGLCPPQDNKVCPWLHEEGLHSGGWADPIAWLAGGLAAGIESGLASMGSRAAATEGSVLVSGLTKSGARGALADMGLTSAQEAAGRSAISRATSTSTIDLIKQPADNLMVLISRPGRDGIQIMQSTISPNGAKSVTQVIIDGAARVFLDPKKGMP